MAHRAARDVSSVGMAAHMRAIMARAMDAREPPCNSRKGGINLFRASVSWVIHVRVLYETKQKH